jgi:hypothetical protein
MINYTWKIKNLWTKTIDGQQDYVVIAAYDVTGVDGEFTSSLSNTAQFSTSSVTSFVPYADLTEEIVLGWIQSELGENGIISITACIEGQIESQKNPPVSPEITPLPWAPAL